MITQSRNFTQSLRMALSETKAGPTKTDLIAAPTLDHWLGVSRNGAPAFCGKITQADIPPPSTANWTRTSIIVGIDPDWQWMRSLNRFYRLSSNPRTEIEGFELGFGRLILNGLQHVSQQELSELVDAFAMRARWYLQQIN